VERGGHFAAWEKPELFATVVSDDLCQHPLDVMFVRLRVGVAVARCSTLAGLQFKLGIQTGGRG
jgi:hypothetical protein